MKRIAIFLEGESEIIFSSYLIKVLYCVDGIRLKYVSWKSDDDYQHNFKPEESYGNTQIEFTLFNFGNDKRVVNKLIEDGKPMLQKGYDTIIGLRDVKSQEYDKLANKEMNPDMVRAMISNTRAVLKKIEGVKLFFAVMELEAWYLALTTCLVKAGYNLQRINATIGANLEKIDPEKEFHNPKSTIRSFEPNFKEIQFAHKIGSKLEISDLKKTRNSKKVKHFFEYTNAIELYK